MLCKNNEFYLTKLKLIWKWHEKVTLNIQKKLIDILIMKKDI